MPQPMPTPNDSPPIWGIVVQDIAQRAAEGRVTYSTDLQPFNGRNALQDRYEELLDASLYCKQEIIEKEKLLAAVRVLVTAAEEVICDHPQDRASKHLLCAVAGVKAYLPKA
mgnify:CR=1 FL=1